MAEDRANFTIPIAFEMTGTSREEAASVLHVLLTRWSSAIRDVPVVDRDGHVSQPMRSWWFPEASLKHIDGNTHSDLVLREPDSLAATFEGSPIPDLLTEMFPPQPQIHDFLKADGTQDTEAFEQAHEQWRDTCLSLAVQAAHLPDLIKHLRRAETVRDGLIDLVERLPLPREPRQDDYIGTSDAPPDDHDMGRYGTDHRQWQADTATAARKREVAIASLLADGGARTPFLPSRFHNDWLPADLLAAQTLRAVVTQEDAGGPQRRVLDRDQRAELRAMLFSADPVIRIIDPDEPDGSVLFRGPASEAALWIPYGVYPAIGDNDQGAFRVVVGPAVGAPGQAASAAFPVGDHDTAVINQIGRILATHPSDSTVALSRIAQLVASTGRDRGTIPPVQAETALERGSLLGELLRQREQELETTDRTGARAPDRGSRRDAIG